MVFPIRQCHRLPGNGVVGWFMAATGARPKEAIAFVCVEKLKSSVDRIVYRRIFVYTFCLINICLSLSDDANKIKTLNIERA